MKKTLLWVGLILLVAFAIWYQFYTFAKGDINEQGANQTEINNLKAQHRADSLEKIEYQTQLDQFNDSVMSLNVQKGYFEIELNKANAQLTKATTRYTEKKESKDTAGAIKICDSIVFKYLPEYVYIDSSLHGVGDTLQTFTGNWIAANNNRISILTDRLDSTSSALIEEKQKNKVIDIPKLTKKEQRKKVLGSGVIGAAIGVLLTLILSR